MNHLIYSPFQRVNGINRELNRVFDDGIFSGLERKSEPKTDWLPQVDIRELEQEFQVTIDVPGVDANNIDITLERKVLAIKGSREDVSESDAEGYKRKERFRGSFSRQFTLPETADGENISARANNGVLTVIIPKTTAHQPRTIEVQSVS